MLNSVLEKYDIFLFVFVRITGFVMFNPVFGRRNIPGTARAGLALVLAVFALLQFPADYDPVDLNNVAVFALLLLKEFAFGFLAGTVVNIFFSVVSISGEIIDIQMGLGMSKIYDPASNIQMPLSGNFYNIALMLIFFMTNCHTTLIEIIILSFKIAPVNSLYLNPDMGVYLMKLFGDILILSLKFGFPVMAAELITETGVGIVMRAVPQINVFVVGLQLKIIAGIAVMIVCAPVSVWFFDGMLRQMGESVYESLIILAGL